MLRALVLLMMVFAFANASTNAENGHMKMKKMFQSVDVKKVDIRQSGKDKYYCPNCGMSLPKFWKTSHAVKMKDGSYRQFCSIYCLVEQMEITELREKKDQIMQILVVDVPTLKYMDAKEAFYVVGSSKSGTMTVDSKYAFKNEKDAKMFAKNFGGKLTDFDGAYALAIKDFARDTGLVLAKRTTKMYKMGKKLFENKCDKSGFAKIEAHTMGEMKASIKDTKVCGEGLNDKKLQAITLYYWDIKLKMFDKLYGDDNEIKKHAEKFKEKFQKMSQGK